MQKEMIVETVRFAKKNLNIVRECLLDLQIAGVISSGDFAEVNALEDKLGAIASVNAPEYKMPTFVELMGSRNNEGGSCE